MKYKTIVVFISLVIITIIIQTAGGTTHLEYIYKMDQKVSGEGFFSSRQNIITTPLDVPVGSTTGGVLTLNKLAYGSGSYNAESTITALNGANNDNNSGNYLDINERNISLKDTVDLAYAAKAFNLGQSFSSTSIKALGKEETCIKNYGAWASMDALFDSASMLSKDLSADLDWKSVESGDIYDPTWNYSLEQHGITRLNVDATFTGKGHIGAQAQSMDSDTKNMYQNTNMTTMIDEDYVGTYKLSKKMSYEFNYKSVQEIDSWLSCCYGGWDTMPVYAKKVFGASANGVFDCTCYKARKMAQFHEPYENKAW